jgi:hypothetical protein
MVKRIPGCDDQEYAECCVDSEDHLQVKRSAPGVPSPARWPNYRKWIHYNYEGCTNQYQSNFQILEPSSFFHIFPLCLSSLIRPTAALLDGRLGPAAPLVIEYHGTDTLSITKRRLPVNAVNRECGFQEDMERAADVLSPMLRLTGFAPYTARKMVNFIASSHLEVLSRCLPEANASFNNQ